ncbi:MAG TPA: isoprenylcysteine carboxylmethyltransferase family protein [Steroidobacteraceae bacterium]|jgi:protein-S-isoprenylcysteine O-methyltransferase|nr:isoprenylcysteine carboxylmethyltransferase family protein [Steroidobacteraceae bacterium]
MSLHDLTIWLALAFGLSELALSLAKRSSTAAVRADRGSLHVLWIVITAAWVLAFFLSDAVALGRFHLSGALDAGALLLFAAGVALRWWAIASLGRLFTVDVAIAADHRLIDRGPYRLIRHPSYAGALLAFLGLGLTLGSLPALAALLLPCVAAYHYRITVEEAALQRGLGNAYFDYMRQTWRLVPRLY